MNLNLYIALLLSTILFGCESKSVQSAYDEARGSFDELIPLKDKAQTAAKEEVSKLFTFEYKVAEIDNSASSAQVEALLSGLGRERWECFDSAPLGGKLRFFCKRKPDTVLKYIPRAF